VYIERDRVADPVHPLVPTHRELAEPLQKLRPDIECALTELAGPDGVPVEIRNGLGLHRPFNVVAYIT
jgi:hypothetical protein